jgi:hypothetical protein
MYQSKGRQMVIIILLALAAIAAVVILAVVVAGAIAGASSGAAIGGMLAGLWYTPAADGAKPGLRPDQSHVVRGLMITSGVLLGGLLGGLAGIGVAVVFLLVVAASS